VAARTTPPSRPATPTAPTIPAAPPTPTPGGGAQILGAHLEGPFISPHYAGALNSTAFLAPAPDVFRRLLLAGEGCLAMMTVAPELPRALSLIGELVEAGVVVSLGHSGASYAQAEAAIKAGARSATHLFNAMAPFHHRAPGLLGAALDLPQVSCELILDGFHVDPVAARLAHRLTGSARMHLVTDAVSAAGLPHGSTALLGETPVRVDADRAVLADGGALAGSTLTMDVAVANAVRFLGIDLPQAVMLASTNPARLLGLEDRKGAIAPGMDADLTVLDESLRACGTIVAGEWVYAAPV
jgi:N-acetylglucosamine-6-phosphate deacetylase